MRLFPLLLLSLGLFSPFFRSARADVSAVAMPASFRETVARHIEAIQTRKMETLLDTITAGEKLCLILPGGQRLATRREYLDFHADWFSETNWSMQFEPLDYVESPAMGVAVFRTRYRERAPNGSIRRADGILSLGFARENGTWRLVFDQNTRVLSDAQPAEQDANSGKRDAPP